MAATTVPDGFYDNRSTMRRENWRGNQMVEFIAARMITAPKPPNAQVPWAVASPWGTYPDLPKEVAS
jgi:hypothetical protein